MASKCSGKQYLVQMGDKKYPTVEWWTTVGGALGLFPTEVSCRRIATDDPDEIKYEAVVEVRKDGAVVTRCSHIASSREINKRRDGTTYAPPWTGNEYSVRSMATTRAVGKAFRIGFSWLAILAGLAPTPAEEMPHEEPQRAAPAQRRTSTAPKTRPAHGPITWRDDRYDGALTAVVGAVEEIESKPTSNGGTKYSVKVNGRWYSHFNDDAADLLAQAHEAGIELRFGVATKGKYSNLHAFREENDPGPAPEVVDVPPPAAEAPLLDPPPF